MGATLTERRRVRDEALRGVNRCQWGRIPGRLYFPGATVPAEEAPANSVPAAAVTRRGRALFGFTGRKGRVGGQMSPVLNSHRLTGEMHWIPSGLRTVETSGIPGVAVECVEIWKNTSGEGDSLGRP